MEKTKKKISNKKIRKESVTINNGDFIGIKINSVRYAVVYVGHSEYCAISTNTGFNAPNRVMCDPKGSVMDIVKEALDVWDSFNDDVVVYRFDSLHNLIKWYNKKTK